jgi:hypothetical protein
MLKKGLWALAAVALTAGIASAGTVDNTAVTFFTVDGLQAVKGTLRVARNSADNNQYIGCSIYAYASGSHSIVCTGRNAAGQVRNCQTSDANMIKVALSLNPASYLFYTLKTDGVTCDRVIAVNESFNL